LPWAVVRLCTLRPVYWLLLWPQAWYRRSSIGAQE
jgi:hypothetical protein